MGSPPRFAVVAKEYSRIALATCGQRAEQRAPFVRQYDMTHLASLGFMHRYHAGIGVIVRHSQCD
jgi:hypothetical protein